MHVIKIGGNELDNQDFLNGLVTAVSALQTPAVLVHGGGRAIANLQQRLGLEPVKVDGLRVTDADGLAVAEMVLSGQVNKRLVAALLAGGVEAVGLSGVDGGLLRCRRKTHPAVDLGFVGEIVRVNTRLLHALLAQGLTPVISPISLGEDGAGTALQVYNVNADEAAAAIAAALSAETLTFLSNVPGVLDRHGRPLTALTPAETAELIAQGVIAAGMVPKVNAALQVLDHGVARTRIVDLAGLANGGGTLFHPA
jgi:acetylglutamate kinase